MGQSPTGGRSKVQGSQIFLYLVMRTASQPAINSQITVCSIDMTVTLLIHQLKCNFNIFIQDHLLSNNYSTLYSCLQKMLSTFLF